MKYRQSLSILALICSTATLQHLNAQTASAPAAPEAPPAPKVPEAPETVVEAVNNVAVREEKAAQIQAKIDTVADVTMDLELDYKAVLRELEIVNAYNAQMKRVVASQEEEIAILRADLDNLQDTQRQIIPLLLKMIEALDQFVENDTPFLEEERTSRVEDLKALMDRGDVTLAEKFRNVMDAYLEENSYSRNIEAYKGQAEFMGQEATFEFLRIGRIALFLSSLDGSTVALWDADAGSWATVEDAALKLSIGRAFKIARKEIPVDLLILPVSN